MAAAGLTHDRRRALDAAIVSAIEQLAGERLGEHVDRLASHAFRGEMWDKAVTYLQKAADRAVGRGSYQQAVTDLDRALVALRHLPEDSKRRVQLIDVKLLLRGVFNTLGDLDKSLVHGRDALLVAEELGDLRRVVQSCTWLATSLGHAGRGVEALALGHRARAAAKTLDDRQIDITVNMVLGFASWILGHYRDAKASFDANLELIPDRIEVAAPGPSGPPV